MSSTEDQARQIAERVARRLATEPARREYSAPQPNNGADATFENRRARMINFVSAAPPLRTQSSIASPPETSIDIFESRPESPQVAQSPWLAPFSHSFIDSSPQTPNRQSAIDNQQSVSHPSQERFGVDEAAVSELVEFFEAEKQCSVDPSGKPCDHCSMCSSRGF